MSPDSLPERLRSKFSVLDTGCWQWAAGTNGPAGYGMFWQGGRRQLAHRVTYEMLVGPIPVALEMDHLCRNRRCVNPTHLEAVTRRTNQIRGAGVSGLNAAKDRCDEGHEFSAGNTYTHNGWRHCRVCRAAASRRLRLRRREDA